MRDFLDHNNSAYFQNLLKQIKNQTRSDLFLFEKGHFEVSGKQMIYPFAVAPQEALQNITVIGYSDLAPQKTELSQEAQKVILGIQKMQAGTGTHIDRRLYKAHTLGIPIEKIKLGAKGTDLFIPQLTTKEHAMSIAEAQILQVEKMASAYKKVEWYDIVSHETQESLMAVWDYLKKKNLVSHLDYKGVILQNHWPTLDEQGELSFQRTAPAGHGLFGFQNLIQMAEMSPHERHDRIWVLSNGEDLSSTPDPLMVGYMKKHRIPILMITTDKTEIDIKGGQIALTQGQKPDGSSFIYPTIVEHIQADQCGQKSYFEELGLTKGERKALFNTNMVLFNLEVLGPLLEKELKTHGREHLELILAPDLISNWKTQIDPDGVTRKYRQLEGALGSVILNLDRHFRKFFNEPLITFLNVEREKRTQFFAPIKTAIDFYIQFHSDRFKFDSVNYTLEDLNPGHWPMIKIEGTSENTQNIEVILEIFKGAQIRKLEKLHLKGPLRMGAIELKGHVIISRSSQQPCLVEEELKKRGLPLLVENMELQL